VLHAETLKAARDLGARRLFPVHSSKFSLQDHEWDRPLIELSEANKGFKIPLVTPVIGEAVDLTDMDRGFRK